MLLCMREKFPTVGVTGDAFRRVYSANVTESASLSE